MRQHCLLLVQLLLLLIGMSLFTVSCSVTLDREEITPSPTPVPGGSVFFEPSRVSAETRAVECRIIDLSGPVPTTESAIVISEPLAIEAITTTLLNAVSGSPSARSPATQQESNHLIALYLWSRGDIVPLSGTGSQWLVASLAYHYRAGVIGVERLDPQGGRNTTFYPIGLELLNVMKRELAFRGLTLP
jgi:hypothetical protein